MQLDQYIDKGKAENALKCKRALMSATVTFTFPNCGTNKRNYLFLWASAEFLVHGRERSVVGLSLCHGPLGLISQKHSCDGPGSFVLFSKPLEGWSSKVCAFLWLCLGLIFTCCTWHHSECWSEWDSKWLKSTSFAQWKWLLTFLPAWFSSYWLVSAFWLQTFWIWHTKQVRLKFDYRKIHSERLHVPVLSRNTLSWPCQSCKNSMQSYSHDKTAHCHLNAQY